MKIYKQRRHALFDRPVSIGGRDYLAVGVMLYFDLAAPDSLHTEQELWKELAPLLGTGVVLDQGWPKPHAEVLCAGSAHAPGGRPAPAMVVGIACGPVRKILNVFGDRFWRRGRDGILRLTDPQPFTAMPIDWRHAFGGPDFKDNPLGRGIAAAKLQDGTEAAPLPNVEGGRLIGAPTDRPAPASFGVVDVQWPARAKKNGTYDDAWVKTRWPAFPDDLNPEFFCMAQEDQHLPGFLFGDEAIEITGMHPHMPVITSRLPAYRVRAFVTRRDAEEPENLARATFEEVGLKPETLWLFPEILRGVLLFRGMVRCADDEYSDLARLYVADEPAASAPRPLEFYRDDQRKKADLAVPFDPAVQQRYRREMARGAKRVLNLPKELREIRARRENRAPTPVPSQADIARTLRARLAGIRAAIDSLEKTTGAMRERFGPVATVDLDVFPRARARADAMEKQLGTMLEQAENIRREKGELAARAGAMLERPEVAAALDEEKKTELRKILAEGGEKKEASFHGRGFPLLMTWRANLALDGSRLAALARLGLEGATLRRRWLGWNPEPREERYADWGLPAGPEGRESFVVPAGLVLPGFDGARLNRLAVRPWPAEGQNPGILADALADDSADFVVPGSAATAPPCLEAARESGVVAIVSGELAAAYVEQEAGDFAHVAACAAPGAPLAEPAASALKKSGAAAVVVLAEAGPRAGSEAAFSAALPGCRFARLPEAKNVFDAHLRGIDVREAICEQLPPKAAREHSLVFDAPGEPKRPGAKKLADIVSAQAIADVVGGEARRSLAEAEAVFTRRAGALSARAAEMVGRANAEGMGLTLPTTGAPRAASLTEEFDRDAKKLEILRDKALANKALASDKEAEMNRIIAEFRKLGPKLDAHRAEQLGRLQAFEPPPEAARAFAKAGLDPALLRPQKAEAVLAAAKAGGGKGGSPAGMAGATLSGLDLSGKDLSGLDLSRARLSKCLFRKTKLAGARFDSAMLRDCDFTGADLSAAGLDRAAFQECRLDGTDLRRARGEMTIFRNCGLKKADLSGCELIQAVAQESVLAGASLREARLRLCILSEGDATELAADGARFEKCVFKKLRLDGASFRNISTDALLWHGCSGTGVGCAGSELYKFRISHDAAFPGLDLTNVTWKMGYCRRADLSGADFRGAELEQTIFDSCSLVRANMTKTRLRRCRFLKSDLTAAALPFADLFMASLRKSRLVQADLRGANCYAADFYKTVFGETRLEGANLKRSLLEGHAAIMREKGLTA